MKSQVCTFRAMQVAQDTELKDLYQAVSLQICYDGMQAAFISTGMFPVSRQGGHR